MPRVRRPTASTNPDAFPGDQPLEGGLESLGQDPTPTATRTPRKRVGRPAKAVGNRGKISARSPSGRVMSKAQMIDKVSAEIYMYLSLAANGWELAEELRGVADPCARVLFEDVRVPTPDGVVVTERLAGVAERITSIVARNDKLLATVAKSGIIGDLAVLVTLLWPVGRLVVVNHLLGSGHGTRMEASPDDLAGRYPVPAFG
jgi:hypothetical protein